MAAARLESALAAMRQAVLAVGMMGAVSVSACSVGSPAARGGDAGTDGTPGGGMDDTGDAARGSVATDSGVAPNDAATLSDAPRDSSADAISPSSCGATAPPASAIIDSSHNVWTLTPGAQVVLNGVVQPATNDVALLLYFNGIVYQEAHSLWWGWIGGAWQAQSAGDPRTAASCSVDESDGGPLALSYMIGIGGSNMTSSEVAAYESFTGRPMDIGTDGITVDSFVYPQYTSGNGRALGKVLGWEMLSMSWDTDQSLTDMNQAASGAYDSTYQAMAQKVASLPYPILSIRVGWEMNGTWYPWSQYTGQTSNATTANYIATYQRIAKIIRQYGTQHIGNTTWTPLLEWCVNIQTTTPEWPNSSATPLDYWVGAYDATNNPGGADVVTMDWYEGGYGSDPYDGDFGLNWLSTFAQQNGVKMGLSEVGTGLSNSPGQGGGCPCSNDGATMKDLINWMNSLPAGLFHHFIFSPWQPADDLTSSNNGAIQQVWHASWGDTHFNGAWYGGPPVPSQP
jgi:hypothetical protein